MYMEEFMEMEETLMKKNVDGMCKIGLLEDDNIVNFRCYIICKYDEKVVASSYGLMENSSSREFCGLWGN
jgi:hypothetical protein